jgi:MFS family permease
MDRSALMRVFGVVFFTTALGGLIFQATTFALPKVFDERLAELAGSATAVGGYAFVVFSIAAFAQLVVGYLVDRHSVRLVFAWVAAAQAIFFVVMLRLDGVAALLVSIAFMLVVFGQIPINDVLVGRAARSEWRARAYALRYIVTFSVSATAVPLIAWLHGGGGFEALFLVLAAAAGAIFAAVLFLPGTSAIVAGRPAPAGAD